MSSSSISSFVACVLGVLSKKPLPNSKSQDDLLLRFLGVLTQMFRSLIHCVNFYVWCEAGPPLLFWLFYVP